MLLGYSKFVFYYIINKTFKSIIFNYRTITFYGIDFSDFIFKNFWLNFEPHNPKLFGLGCSHFTRRYFGNRVCFLFLYLVRCFSSVGYPTRNMNSFWSYRLPYSGISGSMLVSSLSEHFVGDYALHRISEYLGIRGKLLVNWLRIWNKYCTYSWR